MLLSLNLPSLGKGVKPGINRNIIYNLIIGLPPLNEQNRIVKKVDMLMKLCDELDMNMKDFQNNTDLLMQAILQVSFKDNQKPNKEATGKV
jgi:type I restriction enzyme S subunit